MKNKTMCTRNMELLIILLNNCPPHSRYFSDELGGQIFAKLSN